MTCPASQAPSGRGEGGQSAPSTCAVSMPLQAQLQLVILEGAPEKQRKLGRNTGALNVATLGEQGCLLWPFTQTPPAPAALGSAGLPSPILPEECSP